MIAKSRISLISTKMPLISSISIAITSSKAQESTPRVQGVIIHERWRLINLSASVAYGLTKSGYVSLSNTYRC
nr:MAG TPA: hypothetical protein [Caudoviricetes sp.]